MRHDGDAREDNPGELQICVVHGAIEQHQPKNCCQGRWRGSLNRGGYRFHSCRQPSVVADERVEQLAHGAQAADVVEERLGVEAIVVPRVGVLNRPLAEAEVGDRDPEQPRHVEVRGAERGAAGAEDDGHQRHQLAGAGGLLRLLVPHERSRDHRLRGPKSLHQGHVHALVALVQRQHAEGEGGAERPHVPPHAPAGLARLKAPRRLPVHQPHNQVAE
mmetsp:Transcript_60879/g.177961  ORF Transcript_60879/g.177961 Transcript_60879/m.177961 type:complete len:218 (+) Transcript_60879:215-868(+)